MNIEIHDEQKKAINDRANNLVSLIEEIQETKSPSDFKNEIGSLKDVKGIDLGNVNGLVYGQVDFRNNPQNIYKSKDGRRYGLNDEKYKEFIKLIEQLFRIKEVKQYVSQRFVEDFCKEWIFDRYEKDKKESNFCEVFVYAVEESIILYKIAHPILYLAIDSPFLLDNIEITYHKEELLDKAIRGFETKYPGKANPFSEIKTFAIGNVFSISTVKAEFFKAEEIALKRHSLAVEILKITSETIDFPDYKISFDIDNRTKLNANNRYYAYPVNDFEKVRIQYYDISAKTQINDDDLQRRISRGLGIFSKLLQINLEHTPLVESIIFSVNRFAIALTELDYHSRVIDIFTAIESLILRNEREAILEKLQRYVPKLVTKDAEQRKTIETTIRKMYDVRSAMVHRGIRQKFDLLDLGRLQRIVLTILSEFVKLTESHYKRETILNEIDEAINRAYP